MNTATFLTRIQPKTYLVQFCGIKTENLITLEFINYNTSKRHNNKQPIIIRMLVNNLQATGFNRILVNNLQATGFNRILVNI